MTQYTPYMVGFALLSIFLTALLGWEWKWFVAIGLMCLGTLLVWRKERLSGKPPME